MRDNFSTRSRRGDQWATAALHPQLRRPRGQMRIEARPTATNTTNATVAQRIPLYPSTRGGKAATAPEPQARAAE
ncbi:hypothetical protein GS506_04525 [Rhodococcus hoagii]|nr:hypothetical protein [Prescottella equi]